MRILHDNGIALEVKIVSSRDLHRKMHDRYLIGSNTLWSLPPTGSVLEGQSSAFKEFRAGTENYEQGSKDYADWWNNPDALEIMTKWNEIKTLTEQYAKRTDDQRYIVYCAICGEQTNIPFPPTHGKSYYCPKHLRIYRNRRQK